MNDKKQVSARDWLPDSIFNDGCASRTKHHKYSIDVSMVRIGEIVAGISLAKFILGTIPKLCDYIFTSIWAILSA